MVTEFPFMTQKQEQNIIFYTWILSPLKPGTPVNKGEQIGLSGNTGRTGDGLDYKPHVHYETRKRGGGIYPENVTNPKQEDLDYLDKHFIDLLRC